jgi:exonuclease SbcD
MRLIHTADWHLGRILHGVHLTEDQAHVLDQFVTLVHDSQVDAVLIAGDVYDRAVPPPEAVALLDESLARLVRGLQVPVLIIAGNHDSPTRLAFASRLLEGQGLHVVGALPSTPRCIVIRDRHGPVYFYALPYAEPAVVRASLENPALHDHAMSMQALLTHVRAAHPDGARAVLMTHAFVLGGEESESERPLSVGGAGTVPATCFAGFHYVALGHLHRPQSVGEAPIHYAGSLLQYSFAEANHTKSVSLVDIDAHGRCTVERIPLTPRREVRCLTGTLAEILAGPQASESRDDYLMVTLLDREPILDAMGKLRTVYPNVLHLIRPQFAPTGEVRGQRGDHRRLSDVELFNAFFEQMTGEALNPAQAEAYTAIIETLRQGEREATV